MQASAVETTDAYEALMQFLYQAPVGLVQTTLDGSIEMINPMSARLLMPLSPSGSLDNLFTVLDSVAPQLPQSVAAFAAASGVVCDSLRVALPVAGTAIAQPKFLSVSLLKLDANRMMAVLSDVTLEVEREQQDLARQLREVTHIDNLTQMPNRIAVREHVQRVIERAALEPDYVFAVLFMNCDRFKQINDTLGPAAGDQVLGMVADRLRATLRQNDRVGRPDGVAQMAARIGGDEFVVVLDDMRRAEDVHAVTTRLLSVLSKPYGIGTHQIHCTISMGIVLAAQAKSDADTLLQDASIAMAEAKRAGGDRYRVFEPAMQERAAQRGDMEVAIRRALVESQLFVVYQPVLTLRETSLEIGCAGVEALVRWRHPIRGIVPPVEFVSVAEECGLITALGSFVLESACHQFMQWQQQLGARAPGRLAVNLSRAQLTEPGFVDEVRAILGRTGMPPERLQLEVTESLAAQDDVVQNALHELKALHLTLALDDFGTGYSSLASLHLLPIDTVKIDRSFVAHADTSNHHRVLIDATVRVANSLGMDTVAEGIETEAQASVVRQLGCDKGQGYLFSRPLEAVELTRWLTRERSQAA